MELVKIDKDYVFSEIANIYELVENNISENVDYRNEILERLASLQSYCKEDEENGMD